jgi:hypothetical protein
MKDPAITKMMKGENALRFEAHGLWRIQGHGRRLEINVA